MIDGTVARTVAKTGRRCSIARSLEVLGEKWTILIIREAFWGRTRFSEFREALGVSSDILSDRLATLVDGGVLERVAYRDDGARERFSYHLTDSGRELKPVLAALNTWGEAHRPSEYGRSAEYREIATGRPAQLSFHAPDGRLLTDDEVEFVRGPAVLPAR